MSALPFPHPLLTPIEGKPTALTITRLRKEVYANARSVHYTGGGGDNGFLGLVMEADVYLLRAGEVFVSPEHPGTQPIHAGAATQSQITATNRLYDTALDTFRLFAQVREALRQQILTAVDATYYNVLEDDTFGYADVTIIALLHHLQNTYAKLTADDLELNRMQLSEAWTPDEPLENLWIRIKHLRAVATAGGEPLSDSMVMCLTLSALEKAGVYAHSIRTWRDRVDTECTWPQFMQHFLHGEKERLHLLTVNTAGYHGAHAAITSLLNSRPAGIAAAAQNIPTYTYNSVPLGYCWTHGLTKNHAHTSITCSNPATGHMTNATLNQRMGGSKRLFKDTSGNATQTPRPSSSTVSTAPAPPM